MPVIIVVDNKRRLPNRPGSAGIYLRNETPAPATYASPLPDVQRQAPYLTHDDAMERFAVRTCFKKLRSLTIC